MKTQGSTSQTKAEDTILIHPDTITNETRYVIFLREKINCHKNAQGSKEIMHEQSDNYKERKKILNSTKQKSGH